VPSWPDARNQPAQSSSALHHASVYLESTSSPTTLSETVRSATSASIYASPIPSAITARSASTTLISLNTGIPTHSATTTATITVLATVLVQPTTQSVALQESSPGITSEAAAEAIQPTRPLRMPPTVQIGLGVGIAVCVLSLSGMAAFYTWRRRKNSNQNISTPKADRRTSLNKFFTSRRYKDYKDNKDDAEWSIESVEKVAIVRNMRAQSVLTVSRSNSRRSNETSDNGTVAVGIHGRVPTLALNSHPMTPSDIAFDTASSPANLTVSKDSLKNGEKRKPSSWPLDN
jgi:hypothetical protein